MPRFTAELGDAGRHRVLFVSEAVTLAQVVRLVKLASALDRARYEVHFASASFPELVFGDSDFVRWPLETISRARIDRALATGRRFYDRATLSRYVVSDLAAIDAARPHLVVGDLRWSLSISARVRGVPFAALANAYWSSHAVRDVFPLPEHPIVRLLGVELAARYFPVAIPRVFAHFARPLNELLVEHGLPPVGSLPEVITNGDYTLYADTPLVAPTRDLSPSHRYIGPVLWSPGGKLPSLWGSDPNRVPVYVTFGSSGAVECLDTVLDALAALPVDVLVATAQRASATRLPRNVHAADWVPGDEAARRARLVITHGGSSTAYQALAEGTPIIGIPFNLDQYLSMHAIVRTGAGILLRSGTLDVHGVVRAVRAALSDAAMRRAAAFVARDFSRYSSAHIFAGFVDEILDSTVDRASSNGGRGEATCRSGDPSPGPRPPAARSCS